MKTLKQIQRLQKAHQFILQENTGTPKEFAKKLRISERELYNIINTLKNLDALVSYSRKTTTYYYTSSFDLLVHVSVQVLKDEKLKTIYAGKTALNSNTLLQGLCSV